jgi:anti-sigma B factor antagonist
LAYDGARAVVTVTGEIDMASEASLRAAIDTTLERDPAPIEVTIDLSEVTFLDSAGIRALLLSHHRATARGVLLRVRDPRPSVASVLQITRVHTLLGLTLPAEAERPRRPR